ncbi:pectate lyase [Adhaeribacter aerolatus]|uniref:Pectate lyase n=1 Tax=Adhaeribacter aerolatus TaxID=670289 RepID=A0A512B2B3_9BACT|nr:pectate lyase [Adhaeribacter aerolatus]GEO06104.1 pectate lyase [Adhaeribacter aerolatus]
MQKLTTLIQSSLLILLLGAGGVQAQQLAFPGAEGFGKYASGGRGGKVVAVTNLNDDGPGSFRQAFNQFPEEPITIIFRVAGIIDLKSPVRIKRSNVTVAGQTAPSDGITLRGHSFMINGARSARQGGNHGNIIIRYLRSRPGGTLASGLYGFDMENCHTVIVDHCSFSWANEEVAAMYDTKNVTVQWSIISEGLYNAGHAKGVRGYGGVWGGQNASYHHNLLAHLNSRAIRFNGARAHDTLAVVDYRNNVVYNWGNANAAYGGEVEIPNGKSQVNVVNNYYKPGPGTAKQLLFFQASYTPEKAKGIGQWYVAGNKIEGAPALSRNNWAGVDLSRLPQTDQAAAKSQEAFPVKVMLPVQTAEAAYSAVLADAGAKLPMRDDVDNRIIRETKNKTTSGTGSSGKPGIIDAPAAVGGWPAHKTAAAPADSDQDGLPDAWEQKYGLNPQDATDGNKDGNNNGYTNLEEFLNGQDPVKTKTAPTSTKTKLKS